jgi:Ca-activated chloride channel family protein
MTVMTVIENNPVAELCDSNGQAVSLKSVAVHGDVHGLVFCSTVRQTYVNATGVDIETTYTFPVAHGAVLTGLSVELNGKRMNAMALPKAKAQERYEDAIEDGDTPVMVTNSGPGLYTADMGNLKPGETAVIEVQITQALRLEMGRIRLSMPTVIGARYGDAHQQGGLATHHSGDTLPTAAYGFDFSLTLRGVLAKAEASSPTHNVSVTAEGSATEPTSVVRLADAATLDRDFILLLEGLSNQAFASACGDGEQTMVMTSFYPTWPQGQERSLLLKVLVDCSGSMLGDSIDQAKAALNAVGAALTPKDYVSYTRFGSDVVHEIAELKPCTTSLMRKLFLPAVAATDADLGGTELNGALQATFQIPKPETNHDAVDVLLITDGAVWNVDKIIAQATNSNHRIFAVGVGSAPSESLLRILAEQSGGACELVTPDEDMSAAVMRMFYRMRGGHALQLDVQWGSEPLWQSTAPKLVVSGETVHLYAQLDRPLEQHTPLVPSICYSVAQQQHSVQAQAMDVDASGVSAKLAGAQWLKETTDDELVEALALRYQLVSAQTNFILVYERAEDEKADGMPALEKIPQMQAAGWGGASSAKMHMKFGIDRSQGQASMRMDMGSANVSSLWRVNRTQISEASSCSMLSSGGMDDSVFSALLRKDLTNKLQAQFELTLGDVEPAVVTPQALLNEFMRALAYEDGVDAFVDGLWQQAPESLTYKLFDYLTGVLDGTSSEICVLFFVCLSNKMRVWNLKSIISKEPHDAAARRTLRSMVSTIAPELRKREMETINSWLYGVTATEWSPGVLKIAV